MLQRFAMSFGHRLMKSYVCEGDDEEGEGEEEETRRRNVINFFLDIIYI